MTTTRPPGVLPDSVIRDPESSGDFVYVRLADDITAARLEQFLRELHEVLAGFLPTDGTDQIATACVGWGRRAFEIARTTPHGFASALPEVANPIRPNADLVVYGMYRQEWRFAEFRRELARIGAGAVSGFEVEHGYQRPDNKELGGFLDGLRNARADRERIVFVDIEEAPDEPVAADGGSYLVTMRIRQRLDLWNALTQDQQESVIGRRKSDGSRLDLPEGTKPADEGELAGLPPNAHVAKAGPRGAARDRVQIFRRGLPYTELAEDGTLDAGLLFASFQSSMDAFLTILGEWMGNPDFPSTGAQVDALFQQGLVEVLNTGVFFVPALEGQFPGERFFRPDPDADRCRGRIVVRKRLTMGDGQVARGELGGFTFQVLDATGQQVGTDFTTDSVGRAVSPRLVVGETYTLRELPPPRADIAPQQDLEIKLDTKRTRVDVANTVQTPNPGYGG